MVGSAANRKRAPNPAPAPANSRPQQYIRSPIEEAITRSGKRAQNKVRTTPDSARNRLPAAHSQPAGRFSSDATVGLVQRTPAKASESPANSLSRGGCWGLATILPLAM